MITIIKNLLSKELLEKCLDLLDGSVFSDGNITAGTQAQIVKNNQQLAEDAPNLAELRLLILTTLYKNGLFFSAALPKKIFPPLFNKYSGSTNSFGSHVDNAIRTFSKTGENYRTDISATIFLSDKNSYEGGELVIQDYVQDSSFKLEKGDAIIYPASTIHRVNPVVRGERLACFLWIESMVQNSDARKILFDMDMQIVKLRLDQGESDIAIGLTSCYHNLLRIFSST